VATIRDIAEAVGVSIGTVDRILHKRGRYSDKTAEAVQKAMADLNYTPNIHARGLKKTKTHRFAALIPHPEQDSGYWSLVADGIIRGAEELGSYGSRVDLFTFDRYSRESCREVLLKVLDSGIEGLILAPVLPDLMKEILQGLELPILFVDSDIPDFGGRTAFIGQDSFRSGILSGKLMSLLLGPAGPDVQDRSVLLIDPPGSNPHLKKRIIGFREYMGVHQKGTRLVEIKEEVDDEKSFHRYLDPFFSGEEPLPCGIFVANSTVYYAASYLEAKGGEHWNIPLIGYDLIPGREEFIEKGIIDFILTQQPEEQGYRGVIQLYEAEVLKKEVQKDFIIPLNIITRENLRTFERYSKNPE